MDLVLRQAGTSDTPAVAAIIREAAEWLRSRGMPLWLESEISEEEIAEHVIEGRYLLAESAGQQVGVLRFDLEDPDVWPEVSAGESAFIHRLAIRRRFAGAGSPAAMLDRAAERAQTLGLRSLRLDCEAARPQLRALYEGLGFTHRGDRQVGPFLLARYERDVGAASLPRRRRDQD